MKSEGQKNPQAVSAEDASVLAKPGEQSEHDPSDPKQNENTSAIPPEVLQKLPPEFRSSFEQSLLLMRSGPIPDPVRTKITAQHISEIISQVGDENRRQFDLDKHGRYLAFAVLALILLFVFLLYWLFRDKPESVQPILTHLIAFAGGIGGGMALRSRAGIK